MSQRQRPVTKWIKWAYYFLVIGCGIFVTLFLYSMLKVENSPEKLCTDIGYQWDPNTRSCNEN